MAVTAVVGAVVAVAGVVNNIDDADKKRKIAAGLSILSEKEQVELGNKIAKENNKNAQIQMIVDAIQKSRDAKAARDAKSEIVMWVLIGTLGITTLGILAWYLKKPAK